MPKQRNPRIARIAAALERIGYEMVAGEPGSVQRFEHRDDSDLWAVLQDDDKAPIEDIVEHLHERGVDLDAFLRAYREVAGAD